MQPYLDERKCPAQQQMCQVTSACDQNAVSYIADDQAALGGRIEFDLEKCDGCGACVPACCGGAISMR
jgi:NAD-dependent dihydropyrimidine dehydrogenase PreA subunit